MKKSTAYLLTFVLAAVIGISLWSVISVRESYQVDKTALEFKNDSLNRVIQYSDFYTRQARIIWGNKAGTCTPSTVVMVDSIVKRYGKDSITTQTILAIMAKESGFHPQIVSYTGDKGLMQISKKTGKEYGLITDRDFFNPIKNTTAGVKYLVSLIQIFGGDKALAILSYNQGPFAVSIALKDGGNINYSYYYSVLRHTYLYAQLQKEM